MTARKLPQNPVPGLHVNFKPARSKEEPIYISSDDESLDELGWVDEDWKFNPQDFPDAQDRFLVKHFKKNISNDFSKHFSRHICTEEEVDDDHDLGEVIYFCTFCSEEIKMEYSGEKLDAWDLLDDFIIHAKRHK